ncbi:hypothetical protein EJ06DRAFT_551126 [Trichodelitschia bisporula]|uniref:Uncharacterized protein n=1 Tax=Trichodelitschia bisporula TaxID=703511 RepID=A0A6G1HMI0_9PEZI|nr:hypothetical protein EJ06DRAFT_551126 [Trichodelitschia bisporula]
MYLATLLTLPLLASASMPLRARMADTTPPTVAAAQAAVQAHISSGKAVAPATLAPLWSALPPIRVSEAIGTYQGGLFDGGAPSAINWFGKQIISETSVNPLLSRAPGNQSSTVFPYPRADIAQARNVEIDGVVTATIMYNRLPLLDYLKVVKKEGGELVLLGRSDLLGKAAVPAYFYLKKVEGQKVDFTFKNPYPNTTGF